MHWGLCGHSLLGLQFIICPISKASHVHLKECMLPLHSTTLLEELSALLKQCNSVIVNEILVGSSGTRWNEQCHSYA